MPPRHLRHHVSATAAVFACASAILSGHASWACDSPLFATGFDRAPAAGSKAALIDAAQRGAPIRVGWELDFDADGAADLAHWADAAFLTLFESEVFAQVDAIHAQSLAPGEAGVTLRADPVAWRGLLSSNGALEGAYSDGAEFPDIAARIAWCDATPPTPAWRLVYRNGVDGEPLAGSKQALFDAVRAGSPLQLGWGLARDIDGAAASVEHTITPVFVTILNSEHVLAQMPEHIAPRGYWDVDEAFFDDPSVMWRGLMTTEGDFDAVWSNRATGEVVARIPQRAVVSWYAQPTIAAGAASPATPPSLAVPDGVILDRDRDDDRIMPQ